MFAALQLMIVRPLRRITDSVIAFRSRPEDASVNLPPSERRDEIGLVQTELSGMQEALRTALAQKTRLAALGTAVSKINHDLRNILASAMVVSDRLEQSQDPEVRHVTPRLLEALDRAAGCAAPPSILRAPRRAIPRRRGFRSRRCWMRWARRCSVPTRARSAGATRSAPMSGCWPTAISCIGC